MNKFKGNFTKKLTKKIMIEFFSALAVYTLAMLAIAFLIIFMVSLRIWHSNELIYRVLSYANRVRWQIFMIVWATGFISLFIKYWGKTLGYLEDIVSATREVYENDNELIELKVELKEVETMMNKIKLNVRRNEQLTKEAEQRKNDLIVYLAHDLKTPLTSVIGYLTLLKDENKISEELRIKYLGISLSKAERLEDLINEFFEITRFNLSNLNLELSRINLTRMLEQLVYEFTPLLKEKNLKCNLVAKPNTITICDINKMERVFDNLIKNAINYSFPDTQIEMILKQDDEGVNIQVINHGNTIAQEKLDRLFEKFYRLDTARTSKTGGAGLGLAIAKEIVELHQGIICAMSMDEKVIFEVSLPKLS